MAVIDHGSLNRLISNKLSKYFLNSECPGVFMRKLLGFSTGFEEQI